MTQHTKSTLMRWNKEELVDHVINLEQNNANLKSNFETQYKNCMNIVNDMNILNKTMKNKVKGSDQNK